MPEPTAQGISRATSHRSTFEPVHRHPFVKLGQQLLWPGAVCLASAAGGVLAAVGDARVVIAVALVVSLPLLSANRALTLAVGSILTLGLIRRLLSPGRIDYDPLLLLPLLLLAIAAVAHKRAIGRPGGGQNAILGLLVAWPLVSQAVVGSYGPGAIYGAAIQSIAFLVVFLASNSYLPNIWHSIVRWCAPTSIALSTYCLFQYYVLPLWDEQWMRSSGLTSIGAAEPRLVRVFGTLESPGPCAIVLAMLLLILIVKLADKLPLSKRIIYVAASTLNAYALILTGVRTALIGVAVALIFLAVRTGNVRLTLITIVGVATATFGISRFVANSSAEGSSILSQDRYNVATIGSDDSFLARLELVDRIMPALLSPLGGGVSSDNSRFGAADNTLIDLLVNFGPVMALGFSALVVILVLRVSRREWQIEQTQEASMVAVVVLILFVMLAGNVFATTSGLFAALVIGWFLQPASSTSPVDADRASGVFVTDQGIKRR